MTEKSTDMTVELSFPRKRESRREWIPIFMGMTKRGKRNDKKEWIPDQVGDDKRRGHSRESGNPEYS
jgi:hypothetical protein